MNYSVDFAVVYDIQRKRHEIILCKYFHRSCL